MKRVTISDAPAMLNTNDRAMWVLGFNAALEAPFNSPPKRGVEVLRNAIALLREEACYRDDEGEDTDALDDLLAWLAPSGVPVDDRPNALSDEDIAEIAERMEATDPSAAFWREFARAVLAANAGVEKWPELPDTRLEQLMQPYGVAAGRSMARINLPCVVGQEGEPACIAGTEGCKVEHTVERFAPGVAGKPCSPEQAISAWNRNAGVAGPDHQTFCKDAPP